MKYYSVAVPVPVYRLFDYSFPEKIQPGSRVRVQFGNTEKIGYVIEELKTGASVEDPREITQIIDPEPLINKSLIKLGKKLSEYYISPLGEIMKSILPVSVKLPSRKLKERPCILPTKSDFILSNEQESVLKAIKKRLKKGEAGEVLIHGATASGKTEIYMHIAQSLIDSGFQMFIIVPEIAITAQIVRRFEERFGTRSIAIWHSRMTPVRRGQTIIRLRSGDAD